MSTSYRSERTLLPRYEENPALQLIIVTGVCYVMYMFTIVSFQVFGHYKIVDAITLVKPYVALPSKELLAAKWWTMISYGFVHIAFWDWFTNMIWLFCFGSVLQALSGYRQVIPLFIYAVITGSIFYGCSQSIPLLVLSSHGVYFSGSQAGIMAIAAAAFTLAPRYKLVIAPGFNIPLWLLLIIYLMLNLVVYIPAQLNTLILCFGGVVSGVVYALFLRSNKDPGSWIYRLFSRIGTIVNPNEEELHERKMKKRNEVLKHMAAHEYTSLKKVDEILDKINHKGYESLSAEEKNILLEAGKKQ